MIIGKILILVIGVSLIVLGYKIAFKYNYKLVSGYNNRKESDRYPIEIEKKYLKRNGIPIMMMGLCLSILSFFMEHTWCWKVMTIVFLLALFYGAVVSEYLVKKELKKLDDN